MTFVIKNGNRKLSAFIPNDLPTKRYDLKKNCFTISAKNIFAFSNNNYYFYDTFEQAREHLLTMLRIIHENADRYNTVDFYGEESVLRVWNKLKIYRE